MTLTLDLEFQSPASYGHDLYTRKKNKLQSQRLSCENKRTGPISLPSALTWSVNNWPFVAAEHATATQWLRQCKLRSHILTVTLQHQQQQLYQLRVRVTSLVSSMTNNAIVTRLLTAHWTQYRIACRVAESIHRRGYWQTEKTGGRQQWPYSDCVSVCRMQSAVTCQSGFSSYFTVHTWRAMLYKTLFSCRESAMHPGLRPGLSPCSDPDSVTRIRIQTNGLLWGHP